jgi:hypothetical protein
MRKNIAITYIIIALFITVAIVYGDTIALSIKQFAGVNTFDDPEDLPPEVFQEMENMRSTTGSVLEKTFGWGTKLNARWFEVFNDSTNLGGFCVDSEAISDTLIFVIPQHNSVYKYSDDGGLSFTSTSAPTYPNGFGKEIIYVGSGYIYGLYAASVFRSTDYGATSDTVLYQISGAIDYIWGAIESKDEATIFVGGENIEAFPIEYGVLFASTDSGKTFAIRYDAFGNNIDIDELLYTSSNTLLAADLSGNIYRSTDDGYTFETVLSTGYSITSLEQLSSGTILSGDASYNMYRSTDDGLSWTTIDDESIAAQIDAIYEDTSTSVIYLGSTSGSDIYISTDDGLSYRYFQEVGFVSSFYTLEGDTVYATRFRKSSFLYANTATYADSADNLYTYDSNKFDGNHSVIMPVITSAGSVLVYQAINSGELDSLNLNQTYYHKDASNPIFQANEILRILPGDVGEISGNEAKPIWYGYIDRTLFDSLYIPTADFYDDTATPETPTFDVTVDELTHTGTMDDTVFYRFSAQYDGIEEGLVGVPFSAQLGDGAMGKLTVDIGDTADVNERITSNVLYRSSDNLTGYNKLITVDRLRFRPTVPYRDSVKASSGDRACYIPALSSYSFTTSAGTTYTIHDGVNSIKIENPDGTGNDIFYIDADSTDCNTDFESNWSDAWVLYRTVSSVNTSVDGDSTGMYSGDDVVITENNVENNTLYGGVIDIDDINIADATFDSVTNSAGRATLWGLGLGHLEIGDVLYINFAATYTDTLYVVDSTSQRTITINEPYSATTTGTVFHDETPEYATTRNFEKAIQIDATIDEGFRDHYHVIMGAADGTYWYEEYDDGLVAYWSFDDSTAYDNTNNGNNGRNYNAADTAGTTGSAKYFDGTDDYIRIGTNPLGIEDQLTLSYWMRYNRSEDTHSPFIHKSDGSSSLFSSWIGDDRGWDYFTNTGGGVTHTVDADKVNGTWHHFAITHNNSVVKYYIDGDSVAVKSLSFGNVYDGVMMMGWNGVSSYGEGTLDEVSLYNVALTGAHIEQIYNAKEKVYNDIRAAVFDNNLIEGAASPLEGETSIKVNGRYGKIIANRLFQYGDVVLDPGGENEQRDNSLVYSELQQYDVTPVSNFIRLNAQGDETGIADLFGNPVFMNEQSLIILNVKSAPDNPAAWNVIESRAGIGNLADEGYNDQTNNLYVIYEDGIYRLNPNDLAEADASQIKQARISDPIYDVFNDLTRTQKENVESIFDPSKAEMVFELGSEYWAYDINKNRWREITSDLDIDLMTEDENGQAIGRAFYNDSDYRIYTLDESVAQGQTTGKIKSKRFVISYERPETIRYVWLNYKSGAALTMRIYIDGETTVASGDLVGGISYTVLSDSVSYNGTVYTEDESFTTVYGINTYTYSGNIIPTSRVISYPASSSITRVRKPIRANGEKFSIEVEENSASTNDLEIHEIILEAEKS